MPDASPLREDAVLQLASGTKLITCIALLQCVEEGLIGLDEPLTKLLPELDGRKILTDVSWSDCTYEESKTAITARHLLSHTSGFGYRNLNQSLLLWAEFQNQDKPSDPITKRNLMPLVFEPGTGWLYGCGYNWAGIAISRLHNGISLEDYMVENIWKKLGLASPFPCFNISRHPEYHARAMQVALLTYDERLEPCDHDVFVQSEDDEGSSGLFATTKDYLAVLTDLISDSPKLLKPATISEMFTPQLVPKSPSIQMLLELRPMWEVISGPISDDAVNHGLGGLLSVGPIPEISQPKNTLSWGGASNVVWWMNRESGVAGFFATQQCPFGNPTVTKLVNEWKKDFWTQYIKKDHTLA